MPVIKISLDENYGENLVRRLKQYGISQGALAREAGMKPSQISRMLKDGGDPRFKTAVKIEVALLALRKRPMHQRSGPNSMIESG